MQYGEGRFDRPQHFLTLFLAPHRTSLIASIEFVLCHLYFRVPASTPSLILFIRASRVVLAPTAASSWAQGESLQATDVTAQRC